MQTLSMSAPSSRSSSMDSFAALIWEDPSALSRSPSPDPSSSELNNQEDPSSSQSQSQGGRKRMLLHSLDEDGEEEEDEESQELEFAFEGEEWGGEEEKMEEEEEGGGESDEEGAFSQMVPAMGGGLDDMDDDDEEEDEDVEGYLAASGGEVEMEDVEEEEEEEWDFSMPSFSSSQPHRSPSLPPPLDPISHSPSIATPPSKNSPPPPANSAAERARRRSLAKSHIQRNLLLPFLSQLSRSLALIPQPGSSTSSSSGQAQPPPDSDADDEDDDSLGERRRRQDGKIRLDAMGSGSREGLVWPNGRKTATKELARVWRVLSMMHEALMDEVVVTKRDIYYKDPKLFGSQGVVDRIVETIASSAGLRRSDFNVRASPKGLWSSKLVEIVLVDSNANPPDASQMVEEDEEEVEVLRCGDMLPTLIPPSENIEDVRLIDDEKKLLWILILEKDAIFQTLCSIKFGAEEGLLITGKGYPDQSTAQFVSLLATKFPRTKILALVDGDPDGLEILSVYKFGSRTAAKLNNEHLGVERIEWLGVKGSEWSSLNIDYDLLIPLTVRDRKKIYKMLSRPAEDMPAEWRRELSHMIHLRHKAEIQLLTSAPSTTSASQPTQPSNSTNINTVDDPSQSQRPTHPRGGMFDDLEEVEEVERVGDEGEGVKAEKGEEKKGESGAGRNGRGGVGRLVEYLEERIERALAREEVGLEVKQEEEEEEEGMVDWFG
ncbi:Spo11/DNA topoisomerase VI subunit A [Mrakia frigida]|uniref:topoisomerase 6A family protein n=1 Tax=Mrakia frigida TaxID=29902 RepID=UPI003FCBF03F